ncbi:MAG: NUDIX domain-containing protein [Archangiaceae bacterium]|nr:NUDIX domain-containing protein [Archangiaceae bacterium]
MPGTPADAFFYVMVVVEHEGRFLMVQEHDHSWFLPAGAIEPPEDLGSAVMREAWQEGGVMVKPLSLLKVEYRWYPGERGITAWWRFTVRAQAKGELEGKQQPDAYSLKAAWFTMREIESLKLRSDEILDVLRDVSRGAPELPLPMSV